MKTDFAKSHAQLIAFALDTALPRLMFSDDFSKHDEEFLFALEQSFLDCNGFSIHFNFEEKK